jgi:hypothetical protein
MRRNYNPDEPCCLYYVSDGTCTDIAAHGYVGISKHKQRREREHRKSGRFPAGFKFEVLLEGRREDCLKAELRYRPNRRIGWNRRAGGGRLYRQLSQGATQ